MEKLSHYILPENLNRLYHEEASSAIGLCRDLADKYNELVDAFNTFSKTDLAWKQGQEGTIRKGILYMKDNLVNTLQDLYNILQQQGFIDNRIAVYTAEIEAKATNLESRFNTFLGSATEDGEILDGRVGDDGITYTNLGEAIRTQIHHMNPDIYLYLGMTYNTETGALALNTNSSGNILYNVIKRKGIGVENASAGQTTATYDPTSGRAYAVALNLANDVAALKCEATNTYFPDEHDIILFYLYNKEVIPVSLAPQCLTVDGYPYLANPSPYKKYNGSMAALNTKLKVDREKREITLGAGFYVLPIYKTGIMTLQEQKITYELTGLIEYLVFNGKTQELSIVDRFHKFLNDEFCLGGIYAGEFYPVEITVGSVSYTNGDKNIISGGTFLTMNDMFAKLGDPSVKTKIVLGGDSITHGTGGTGFAQNGSLILSTGTRDYHRNPNGYCWANLFKEYIESNFNAEVINNGCTGTGTHYWNTYKTQLIPADTDIFILTIGTNDRNGSSDLGSTKEAIFEGVYQNLSEIVEYCHSMGIHIVLCSPIPATAANEGDTGRVAHIFEMNQVIQRVASANNMEYANLYNAIFYHLYEHGLKLETLLPDGLHPGDTMYKLMFTKYLQCFNLAPSYELLK